MAPPKGTSIVLLTSLAEVPGVHGGWKPEVPGGCEGRVLIAKGSMCTVDFGERGVRAVHESQVRAKEEQHGE